MAVAPPQQAQPVPVVAPANAPAPPILQRTYKQWQLFPVPQIGKIPLIVCGILNCIWPGLGVIVAAGIEHGPSFSNYAVVALLQFILLFVIIGWVWAVINGIIMVISGCGTVLKKQEANPVQPVQPPPVYRQQAQA